jgi:hypothetical protein
MSHFEDFFFPRQIESESEGHSVHNGSAEPRADEPRPNVEPMARLPTVHGSEPLEPLEAGLHALNVKTYRMS